MSGLSKIPGIRPDDIEKLNAKCFFSVEAVWDALEGEPARRIEHLSQRVDIPVWRLTELVSGLALSEADAMRPSWWIRETPTLALALLLGAVLLTGWLQPGHAPRAAAKRSIPAYTAITDDDVSVARAADLPSFRGRYLTRPLSPRDAIPLTDLHPYSSLPKDMSSRAIVQVAVKTGSFDPIREIPSFVCLVVFKSGDNAPPPVMLGGAAVLSLHPAGDTTWVTLALPPDLKPFLPVLAGSDFQMVQPAGATDSNGAQCPQ